jgi:hypothetical protein
MEAVGGSESFHYGSLFGYNGGGLLAPTNTKAEIAVATPVSRAGRHKITKSTETIKGFGASAEGFAERYHFMKASSKKSGSSVVTKIEAITNADGDSINVFQATSKAHAMNVVGPVGP